MTARLFDRLSGPVSSVLGKTGKGVEQRTFSYVRTSGKSDKLFAGRRDLRENIPAVPGTYGDHSAADKKCFGVAGGTLPCAGDRNAGQKSQIEKTLPHGSVAEKRVYARLLSGL